VREIPLTQGKVALVDNEDYEELVQYKWYAHKQDHRWYARRNTRTVTGKRTTVRMHREIMGEAPGQDVDHWDGDGLHNWRENLRYCNDAENSGNAHHKQANCTSRYKGVSWFKSHGKWRAKIAFNYKSIHLGLFDNEDDAARAYNAAARQYFGEFACPNVIV
jgi:hypothetical protein